MYRLDARPERITWLKLVLLLLGLSAPVRLHAQTISGVIQDSSGAVIVNARIEISGGDLQQPLALSADSAGKFTSPPLNAGTYSVRATAEGFEPLVKTVEVRGSAELQLTLAIAKQNVNLSVSAKNLAFANTDPVYRELREVGLGYTFRLDNFTLPLDVGTFQFQKGTLTFLKPVNGMVTGAIFLGEGHFHLKPATSLDTHELNRRIGADEVNEDFSSALFRFTESGRMGLLRGVKDRVEPAAEAATVLKEWREKMRQRNERPLGFTEYLLHGEAMDNVDADVLAAIYNQAHPEFINVYLRGKKHKDLRFFIRQRVGAVPQLDSPEEVALINYDPGGMEDGVWYLAHFKLEYDRRTADSREERRLFATGGYKIETVIAKNGHLFSAATIRFAALIAGERLMKFGLLPNLRVSRVSDDQGRDLYFVQEDRRRDGSFYAILAEALPVGEEHSINVEYAGDKVLEEAGAGSYYVAARTSWYPNLNGFGEKALYDLTFKVPRRYKVISVGTLKEQTTEADLAVTHWVTAAPVAVAGFNYGEYERLDLPDEATGYKISGYYLSELPDSLSRSPALKSLAPRSMTKYALEQTRAQIELCTFYFGRSPYDEIYITEQPNFNFGQSWPNLVYLPISAYTDSTQRWMLFGSINSKFTGFVQEVTPHEVSHQWWGHAVGWASYHDQWLSEGFAEFSAGLFLEHGVAGDWRKDYTEFWERLRERVLEKNNFGVAPNDAGPLWMGLRLMSPRTESAYQNVTYPKGAYVLGMMRSIMYGVDDQDARFIAMMHDFVQSHREQPATTESFKAIAEKHMSRQMDIDKNGRLDWFFNEWVYGTQIPRYQLDYRLSSSESGKTNLHLTITQSEVDDKFAMLVPVFVDFGKGWLRIGQTAVIGNSSKTVDIPLPSQPKKVALNPYKEILER